MSQATVITNFWPTVQVELKKLFPRDLYDTWFATIRCVQETEDNLILAAPNTFAAIWLQDNYLELIRDTIQRASGRSFEVLIEAAEEATPDRVLASTSFPVKSAPRHAYGETENNARARFEEPARRTTAENSRRSLLLNPRNTFDNFIVGGSNQLAHAASLAVARAPGKAYNPLFLYGDTGLGKTHLMHAIAHSILDNDPDSNVLYVSCEKFTNEFMRAIQDNSLVKFRRFYRSVDALLIDDIQFLEGKERTQEEFFHTFNEIYESGRQLCLSSDRPANEIKKLESRLISRFQWGMVTDIQAPDLETRMAILRKKANAMNYNIPQEILQFLAQRITKNVRRMEGGLIKVATTASLLNSKLDLGAVERLIQDILQEEAQNQVTIEKIQKRVVEYYELRLSDMVSKRRPSQIAFPRQVAMYLSRLLTNQPLKDIGDAFGGRDHGTVIHACKTVENIMEQDDQVKRSVEFLVKQLSNQMA
ncbi:MAG: chromosomal replication initiator protein DnaA [Verrucomicrobiota bacterium]|nr:chromosomal replication initiator protein DnaA [Verrucomicrobiota bacterium]